MAVIAAVFLVAVCAAPSRAAQIFGTTTTPAGERVTSALRAEGSAESRKTQPRAVPKLTRLRRGVVWQRATTWRWQDYAGVPRTPTAHAEKHTRSVEYLRWMASRWNARRRYAKRVAHNRNRGTVQQVICRVFHESSEVCSTALYIAYRESRYQVTAWNSSDHGGLFQLGAPEREAYASIGYGTAYEQTVAAHNLYQARGWQPWTCCE